MIKLMNMFIRMVSRDRSYDLNSFRPSPRHVNLERHIAKILAM